MSLHTRDIYQKLSISVKVSSRISYDVEYKEYPKYEECVDFVNDAYDGHGNIVSTHDNYIVSIYSSLCKDLAKVYCSDFRLIYDIYGILGEGHVTLKGNN